MTAWSATDRAGRQHSIGAREGKAVELRVGRVRIVVVNAAIGAGVGRAALHRLGDGVQRQTRLARDGQGYLPVDTAGCHEARAVVVPAYLLESSESLQRASFGRLSVATVIR